MESYSGHILGQYQRMSLAYEVLGDEQKRKRYDSGAWGFDEQQQYAQNFDFDSFLRDFQESKWP
ncbi:unnamed protein product [Gongylonema pulchrum]|uniref:J domain-containing protein n=1 Tax=Gongylonema pulchrum TaxID=637853 RepID=A0A183EZC4_9BILA|nr:unnamed protein product [Gongylonema pulchrum]